MLISNVFRGMSFGSVYALLAVGLVLTYKTSGVFNLAFGAQAFVAGAVYYDARTSATTGRSRSPFVLAVLVVSPLLGLRPRPGAVPLPAHRAADGAARDGARPARRDPADREALVRPEPARTAAAGHRPGRRSTRTTRSATSSSAATTSRRSSSRSSSCVGLLRAVPLHRRSGCGCARSSRARA